MTQINKECLARAWAVTNGVEKLHDNDDYYYQMYIMCAEQVIKQYEKELEKHESK